jgi:transcriptional regulator with XRE-family HTH domain
MGKTLLSKRLRELRKVNNYTQDDVAEVLQTSRQTYSHYETGIRKPSTESLYKLAGLYGISVEDLLKLSIELDENTYFDAPGPSQVSEDLSAYLEYFNDPKNQKKYHYHTNLEKELLYYFQKLMDSDKKEIIEFTKIKAKKKRE